MVPGTHMLYLSITRYSVAIRPGGLLVVTPRILPPALVLEFDSLGGFDIFCKNAIEEGGGGKGGGGRGGGFFRRFRSHTIFKYTPAVRSKIGRGLLYAWC